MNSRSMVNPLGRELPNTVEFVLIVLRHCRFRWYFRMRLLLYCLPLHSEIYWWLMKMWFVSPMHWLPFECPSSNTKFSCPKQLSISNFEMFLFRYHFKIAIDFRRITFACWMPLNHDQEWKTKKYAFIIILNNNFSWVKSMKSEIRRKYAANETGSRVFFLWIVYDRDGSLTIKYISSRNIEWVSQHYASSRKTNVTQKAKWEEQRNKEREYIQREMHTLGSAQRKTKLFHFSPISYSFHSAWKHVYTFLSKSQLATSYALFAACIMYACVYVFVQCTSMLLIATHCHVMKVNVIPEESEWEKQKEEMIKYQQQHQQQLRWTRVVAAAWMPNWNRSRKWNRVRARRAFATHRYSTHFPFHR